MKKYSIIHAVSWYTAGNILIKGTSFFVLPIFTKLMNTTEYGIFAIYSSYLSIFETIALLGLSSTIAIAKYDKYIDFRSYLCTTLSLPIIISVLIGIFLNIYFLVNSDFLSMRPILWNCLLITSATTAVGAIIGAKFVVYGEYKSYMLYSLIVSWTNVGISLLLCYSIYSEQNVHMARVIGQMIASILGMFFLLYITKYRFIINRLFLKQSLIWGIPLLFHTLATVILTQSDRIVIKSMDGFEAAGIYNIAVTLLTIPLTLYTSLNNAWVPWFFKNLDNGEFEIIRKNNNVFIIVFGIIIAIFMIITPELIFIFTDSAYWDSIYCLVPLSLSVFGELLYSIPVGVEYYHKKTSWIMWGTICATVVNIVFDIIFIWLWGIIGAAYATTISKLLLFTFHFYIAKKLNNNKIININTVLICLSILVALNFYVFVSVNHLSFRLVTLAFATILLIFYSKKCKGRLT